MDKIKIRGGIPLRGSVRVSGSKNAALPILISSLLTDEECTYDRVPALQDIQTTQALLKELGVVVVEELKDNRIKLRGPAHTSAFAPYDIVRKMRASVLVLGPLVARFGKAKVSLPGGCAIGARPINFHLSALERMGAQIHLEEGYVLAECARLKGAHIPLDFPSVGATENTLMAAVLAEGETVIENAAREPEIVDLAVALRSMGADISGEGTMTITVKGKKRLHGCHHTIMGDRIEAGTFLAAAFATQGEVEVLGLAPEHLESSLVKFEAAGAKVVRGVDTIELKSLGKRPKGIDIMTQPFPGFPTDMQAQFMALLAVGEGTSVFTENIFENRFMHVPELNRMGADISIQGATAVVKGRARLTGAPVMASDLRASAALVVAGLAAQGETTVNRVYHLDRGYEGMEKKLRSLGAHIERVK